MNTNNNVGVDMAQGRDPQVNRVEQFSLPFFKLHMLPENVPCGSYIDPEMREECIVHLSRSREQIAHGVGMTRDIEYVEKRLRFQLRREIVTEALYHLVASAADVSSLEALEDFLVQNHFRMCRWYTNFAMARLIALDEQGPPLDGNERLYQVPDTVSEEPLACFSYDEAMLVFVSFQRPVWEANGNDLHVMARYDFAAPRPGVIALRTGDVSLVLRTLRSDFSHRRRLRIPEPPTVDHPVLRPGIRPARLPWQRRDDEGCEEDDTIIESLETLLDEMLGRK